MAAAAPKMVRIQCDGGMLEKEVDLNIFKISTLVMEMHGGNFDSAEDVLELQGQPLDIMTEVVTFLEMYHAEPMTQIEKPIKTTRLEELVQPKYADYINALHYQQVFRLVDAANFLGIEPLLLLGLSWMACTLKSIPLEELKKMIVIHNDLTPDEEAIFRKDYLDEKKQAWRRKVEQERVAAPRPPGPVVPPAAPQANP